MRRQEREIREKEKRRRKRKSCLRTFLTISFIVVATVLLNGMAALVVWQAFGGLPRPWWEVGTTWLDMVVRLLNFSSVIGAIAWDRLLLIGFCRRKILPKIEVSVSPTRVARGDVVEVAFRVKGTTDWFRRIQGQLNCSEMDDDCLTKDWLRETVFSVSDKKEFIQGSFSVAIPIGFPVSGFNEKKQTVVLWSVSVRGVTAPGFMPDVYGSAEVEVAEGPA